MICRTRKGRRTQRASAARPYCRSRTSRTTLCPPRTIRRFARPLRHPTRNMSGSKVPHIIISTSLLSCTNASVRYWIGAAAKDCSQADRSRERFMLSNPVLRLPRRMNRPDPPPRRRRRANGAKGGFASSVEAVETHRAAGENAALGLGRGALQPLAQHVRRAGEEAVGMRVIGRPQDLVRADIVGEHLDAALDRLERDPAIALEQLAWPRLEAGIVEALVVEVAVHAVEPRCDPAAARFEKRDPDFRVALAHPAPDHAHAGQHHFHRVADDVLCAAPLETVDADRRHATAAAFMKADREIEVL